jgi:hypothetical protein
VRRIQDTSIGAIYDLIRRVNHEVGRLAAEMLRTPAARRPARKKAVKKAASAQAP